MNYKTTPNEEAKLIIKQELEAAGQKMANSNTPQNAENLLLFFAQGIEAMLTKRLENYRMFLDRIEKREKELCFWANEVKQMMNATIEYRNSLDLQQDAFIEKTKAKFIEKMEAITKINYN